MRVFLTVALAGFLALSALALCVCPLSTAQPMADHCSSRSDGFHARSTHHCGCPCMHAGDAGPLLSRAEESAPALATAAPMLSPPVVLRPVAAASVRFAPSPPPPVLLSLRI